MIRSLRESRWVWALLWRCLSYAMRMAACFFGFSLLLGLLMAMLLVPLGILLGALASVMGLDSVLGLDQLLSAVLLIAAGLNLISSPLIGGLGGMITGFYSPRRDSEEHFFLFVLTSGQNGLLYGLLTGLACGTAVEICWDLFFFFCYGVLATALAVTVAIIGQIYGLWRGINLAIQQEHQEA